MYGEEDFDFHREHGITMLDIDQVKARGIASVVEQIRRVVTGPAYMTFDIDSVDPAFAPGTGHAGGRRPDQPRGAAAGARAGRPRRSSAATSSKSRRRSTVRARSRRVLAANLMFEFLCVAGARSARLDELTAESRQLIRRR